MHTSAKEEGRSKKSEARRLLTGATLLASYFLLLASNLTGQEIDLQPAVKQSYVFDSTKALMALHASSNQTGDILDIFNISGTLTCAFNSSGMLVGTGCATAGTLEEPVNLQSATTYTLLASDNGKLLSLGNSAGVAVNLQTCGGQIPFGAFFDFENTGSGAVTLAPVTSTIDGTLSLTLAQNQGVRLVCHTDGNYYSQRGIGSGGGGGGSPGGFDTAVQFNHPLGTFGGDATNFFYTPGTHGLTITGPMTSPAFTSSSANPAGTGAIRLASGDAIKFRNNANSADLTLISHSAQDQLVLGGSAAFVQNMLELPTYLVSALPTAPLSATVVWAIDGTPGSDPCTGSGSGALAITTAPNTWQCYAVSGGGTPGGSPGQYQINNTTFAGSPTLTNSSNDGSRTVQVQPSTDVVPLTVSAPSSGTPVSDVFRVLANLSGTLTKCFWVTANGNVGVCGNNVTYGTATQATASHVNLFGGATANAGSYMLGTDSSGGHGTYLYFDPTAAGTVSLETSVVTGSATAGNRVCTPTNALCGGGNVPSGGANGNILGVTSGSPAWVTTQNFTAKSPSIDPTGSGINGGSPALCNGSTNDQAALQSVLTTISANGGGSLRVPNTGSSCLSNDVFYQVITAISSGVPSGTSGCTSSPYCIATATATVASTAGLPPDNAGLIYIDNIPVGAGGTNYNGIFIITGHTGTTFTFQVSSTAGSGDTATPTANSVATVNLYYDGNNLKFDSSCAAGNASTCSAFKTTGHAPILITYTPNGDHSGPDIRNVSWIGAGTTFAGILVGNTNKFRLDDNAFSGFTGSSGPAAASPWGGVNIGTVSGSQCNIVSVCLVTNPWVQFGSIKFNQWGGNVGFASRGLLSSTIIEGNTTQQANGVNLGTDVGGLQFLNYGNWNVINGGSPDLSGGENFVINDQVQGAAIGAIFGGQNNDRIFVKSELNGAGVNRCNHTLGSANLCSFGLAILDTQNATIFAQSKQLSMGWYIDSQSPGNNVYETNVGGALGTGPAITASSITSNVLTVTTTNTFSVGNSIILTGTAESFLNNQTVVIATVSGSQFTAAFTHANFANASDTGNATENAAPTLLSLCLGWNSTAPMTSTCSSITPNYSFPAASNIVDPAVAALTNVYGTPSTGAFAPTSNSTFTGNQDAVSTTFQQGLTSVGPATIQSASSVNLTGVANSSLPTLPSNSIWSVVNNGVTRSVVGSFGNSARYSTLSAAGTASSPTAVPTTTETGLFNSFAYNGSGWNLLGGMRIVTAQAQTTSNGGSTTILQTTPNATTTPADVLRLEQDGGIDTPGVTGGDKGAGTINAAGLYVNGTAVGTGGTVTSFSAGNLSPLFTSSVATASTTPALTFSLSNAAANTVLGNATGSSAAPGFTANPSVSSVVLNGATSGSTTLSASATGGVLNLGSTGATVDGSGNVTTLGGVAGASSFGWNVPLVVASATIGTTATNVPVGATNLLASAPAGIYEACSSVLVQTVDGGTTPTLTTTIKFTNNSIVRSINSAALSSLQTTSPTAACNPLVTDSTANITYQVATGGTPNGAGTYTGTFWLKRLK